MKKPIIAVVMDGGIISAVLCSDPNFSARVLTIDYDVEGCDADLTLVPQPAGLDAPAYVACYSAFDTRAIDLEEVYRRVTAVPPDLRKTEWGLTG